jgi:Raf kinase inhibitor-like YbhB/YbcL family protein
MTRAGPVVALGGLLMMTACSGGYGDGSASDNGGNPETISITSDAFFDGSPIPERYSCDGENLSPPLTWVGVPAEVASLRLTVTDPDAPNGNFVHWSVRDIGPRVAGVGEGTSPPGVESTNDAGSVGWAGPCPPPDDEPHRYIFLVEAVNESGEVVAEGSLLGTYDR